MNISNEYKMMKALGKISKIHSNLSFVMAITKNKQKVFFSDETAFGKFQFYRTFRLFLKYYQLLGNSCLRLLTRLRLF